jgi:glutaredoxin 3
MPSVVVYLTRSCPYCVMAVRLLRSKHVPFEEVDVTSDPDKRAWLREATGRHTVPQVFIGGRPVGGFDDLAALERSGELDRELGIGD